MIYNTIKYYIIYNTIKYYIIFYFKEKIERNRINMIGKFIILLCFALFCFLANVSNADQLPVANFSKSSLEGWEDKVFTGTTSYQLFQLKDKRVLMAESQDSASGLIKKMHVDLKKYPYLNWSWSIENRLDIKKGQSEFLKR